MLIPFVGVQAYVNSRLNELPALCFVDGMASIIYAKSMYTHS